MLVQPQTLCISVNVGKVRRIVPKPWSIICDCTCTVNDILGTHLPHKKETITRQWKLKDRTALYLMAPGSFRYTLPSFHPIWFPIWPSFYMLYSTQPRLPLFTYMHYRLASTHEGVYSPPFRSLSLIVYILIPPIFPENFIISFSLQMCHRTIWYI